MEIQILDSLRDITNFHKIISALDEFGVDTTFDPKKTFIRVPQVGFNTEFYNTADQRWLDHWS